MKRILILTPAICRSGGGVSEVTRLLTHSIASMKDVEVEVVTLKTQHFHADRSAWPNVKISAFRHFGPIRYGFSPGMLWHTLTSKSDVIHVHGLWMFHCFVALLANYIRGIPYIATPHGMLDPWIMSRSKYLKNFISIFYQNRFLRSSHCIQALTKREEADIQSLTGQEINCSVIPNFSAPLTRTDIPPSWWKPEMRDACVFLFFGRIHEKKGWRELCEAWSNACRNNPNFNKQNILVFCGWIDDSPDFLETIESLQKRYGNVIFGGPQHGEDRSRTLSHANFFVLPSKSEGLPMVVLEAWYLGLPTLLSKECNLEIGFERGAAFPSGTTASEICQSLLQLSQLEPDIYSNASRAAMTLARVDFGEEKVCAKIADLYQTAIGGES